MSTKMKICTKCEKRKPVSGFSKDASKKGGIRSYCKECASVMNRKCRELNKGKKRVSEAKTALKKEMKNVSTKVKKTCTGKDVTNGFSVIGLSSKLLTSVFHAIADVLNLDAEVSLKLQKRESK